MKVKFVIAAQNKPDVFARVVMLFHRAAVDIASIRMPLRSKGNELKITITVDEKHPSAHRMPAILEKVVDVLSVEIVQSPTRGGLPREQAETPLG